MSGLSRAKIIDVAISLLDEVGLDGLTMRRLATELGVKNPALYWHFRNKQQLLDEMSEAIQLAGDSGSPRAGESWRDWMMRRALARRQLLLSHRDGARLIAGTYPGEQVLSSFGEELEALASHGFTPVQAMRSIGSVSHYITGFVLAEQASQQNVEVSGVVLSAILEGGNPLGDGAFEDGIRLLLDGIQASLVGPGA